MRVFWSIMCGAVLVVGVVYLAQGQPEAAKDGAAVKAVGDTAAPEPVLLQTDKDRQSYFFGVNVGRKILSEGLDINTQVMDMGVRDAISGEDLKLMPQEMQQENIKYNEHLRQRMMAFAKQNLEKGKKFLAENKMKQGVTTLPSGVQYMAVREGSGPKPTVTDVVKIHHRSKLLDDRIIDSSYRRSEPPKGVLVNNVIMPGLKEALQLMPVGSKWQLWLPPGQGYPRGGPPNAVIVLEVDLLEIVPPSSD